MQQQTTHDPAFSMLQLDLEPNEELIAEPGAMVAMSRDIEIEAKMNASKDAGCLAFVVAIFAAMVRKILGGESFFVNHFTASQGGSVWLAPTFAGGIAHRQLNGDSIMLSSGAYLASSGDIDVDVKYGGLRGLLAKEGAFFLEVSGTGDVWFNSFGGIEQVEVDGTYTVDNGHIVGFTEGLDYDITSAGGGALGFFASGEGTVCEFKGRGTVYLQTRNVGAVAEWLVPILPD